MEAKKSQGSTNHKNSTKANTAKRDWCLAPMNLVSVLFNRAALFHFVNNLASCFCVGACARATRGFKTTRVARARARARALTKD